MSSSPVDNVLLLPLAFAFALAADVTAEVLVAGLHAVPGGLDVPLHSLGPLSLVLALVLRAVDHNFSNFRYNRVATSWSITTKIVDYHTNLALSRIELKNPVCTGFSSLLISYAISDVHV